MKKRMKIKVRRGKKRKEEKNKKGERNILNHILVSIF